MKGKIKRTLLGVASLVFAAACVGSLVSYEAKANDSALFEMVEGASVRTSADTSGIRFSLRVTSTQQTSLSAYKAVEYGMLITQESEATIDEIYTAGATVFTDSDNYTFNKAEKDSKKFLVNITGNTLVDEKDDEGNATGNKLFNAALTNISQANFTATYVGVGYIKTTSEGETDSADDDVVAYHFASNNDNERTITYVAEKAIAENDENAVGNAVVENYVSGGYANLGLAGAGTEESPYVVEQADYDALKTATSDKLIYGVNKCMQFADDVDYSDLATDFAGRNYNFVWASANKEDEVELFNAPSKTAAAYYHYEGLNEGKYGVNETAVYHDEFNGHYGVVSFKSSNYYYNSQVWYRLATSTDDADWTTTEPSDYDSNKSNYSKKTTYNDFSAAAATSQKPGWRYQIASASDFTKSGSDSWADMPYDYISFWVYVKGEVGESVTISEMYGREATTVNCNEWVEIRYNDFKTKNYFSIYAFNITNMTYNPLFIIQSTSVTSAYDQNDVFDLTGNHEVYIDSFTFGINPLQSLTVEKVTGEKKAQISATKADAVEGEVTYTAKTPSGAALTVADDLTFETGVAGTYTVTASVEYNGETLTQTAEYTVETADLMSELELEGFYTEASKAAVYGVNSSTNKPDRDVAAKNVAWHETLKDSKGVTKYGVVSMTAAAETTYGGVYYVSSESRNLSFQKATNEDPKNNSNWDYVSLWIYIAGTDGEMVNVSGNYNWGQTDVPVNTWYEWRVYKSYFLMCSRGRTNRTFSTYNKGTNSNQEDSSILYVGTKDDGKDYTVYVDSLSYVKATDGMDITVTNNGDNTISVTAQPKAEYADTLAGLTFSYYVNGYIDTESQKQVAKDTNTGNYKLTDGYTEYWIEVRVVHEGVSYVSTYSYIPTATT